ncbi:MAG: polyprenyl diphosphate synthase [Oscillospiraceae bacterium]|nr:polyprenyl diphosphate synthase [Oscillospiraceae bacterium]
MENISKNKLPKHIGIIMDGNGRWAKKRGMPRYAGHTKGARVFRKIIRHCNKIGIQYVTVFAFSTENWKRGPKEISVILKLLSDYLDEAEKYAKENIVTRFIGDCSVFGQKILDKMAHLEKLSSTSTGLILNIAVNYGGRAELVNAVRLITDSAVKGELDVSGIDESVIESHLYTVDQPPVDLVIRPSGEHRLSNFMIWQCAYAEYVFMDDILWPDFNENHLNAALEEYSRRNRRFGAE